MSKVCGYKYCESKCYGEFCFRHKPRKPIQTKRRINQVSDKQAEYHVWLEAVARPFLIARDMNMCSCCGRWAYPGEKLDIEHTLGKGSHPSQKRDLNNLTLMCRIPCHNNKTDGKVCDHL